MLENIDEIVTRLKAQNVPFIIKNGVGDCDEFALDRVCRDLVATDNVVCVVHRYSRGTLGTKRSVDSNLYSVAMYSQ